MFLSKIAHPHFLGDSSLPAVERDQIAIARVLCVYFMMSVHLSAQPGGTLWFDNDLDHFHDVWVDWLARASVAALSFVSGVLLRRSMRRTTTLALISRKAQTLYLPMLIWNIAFILLVLTKDVARGMAFEQAALARLADPFASVFGLTGPTANLSLFFLRDLFVSSVLLMLAAPLVKRLPALALVAVFVGVILDGFAPLLFRPSILLFALAGFVFDLAGHRLPVFTRPSVLLLAAASATALFLVAAAIEPIGADMIAQRLQNIGKRTILIAIVLAVACLLCGAPAARRLTPLAPTMFLVYLSHVPVCALLWLMIGGLFDAADQRVILVYFFAAPALALGVGVGLSRLLGRLPPALQVLLSGKERSPP